MRKKAGLLASMLTIFFSVSYGAVIQVNLIDKRSGNPISPIPAGVFLTHYAKSDFNCMVQENAEIQPNGQVTIPDMNPSCAFGIISKTYACAPSYRESYWDGKGTVKSYCKNEAPSSSDNIPALDVNDLPGR